MLITIMGTAYTVFLDSEEDNDNLKGASAFVATELKEIYVDERLHPTSIDRTIKHELVHAFLIESGLDIETWASNEEIVDWIAMQLDKIYITSHSVIDDFKRRAKHNGKIWEKTKIKK